MTGLGKLEHMSVSPWAIFIVSSWFVLDCPSPAQAGRRPTDDGDGVLLLTAKRSGLR